jgi:hypothetical protein
MRNAGRLLAATATTATTTARTAAATTATLGGLGEGCGHQASCGQDRYDHACFVHGHLLKLGGWVQALLDSQYQARDVP